MVSVGLNHGNIAFSVQREGTYSPAMNSNIDYNLVITNAGGAYHTQRDEFVCPTAGLYYFSSSAVYTSGGTCRISFFKNEEDSEEMIHSAENYGQGSNTIVYDLEVGDAISVRVRVSGCTLHGNDRRFCTFSGFKLF